MPMPRLPEYNREYRLTKKKP